MKIERRYENKERFRITKNEAIYMLLVLLIILCVFVFVLPIFAEKLKSVDEVSKHDGGQKLVKVVNKKSVSLPSKSGNVKTEKAKGIVGGNRQVKNDAGKSEKRGVSNSAATQPQPDIVFILDLSPSMMTRDDTGVRALVGMEWINMILQRSNSPQLYLLCLENKSITEYMLGSKKSIPDSVTSRIEKKLGGQFDNAESDIALALSRAYTRLSHSRLGRIVMVTDGYGMDTDAVVDVIKDHADSKVKVAVFGVGRREKKADYSTIKLLEKDVVPYTNNDIFAPVKENDVYKDVFPPLNYEGLKRVIWALGKNGAYFSTDKSSGGEN